MAQTTPSVPSPYLTLMAAEPAAAIPAFEAVARACTEREGGLLNRQPVTCHFCAAPPQASVQVSHPAETTQPSPFSGTASDRELLVRDKTDKSCDASGRPADLQSGRGRGAKWAGGSGVGPLWVGSWAIHD